MIIIDVTNRQRVWGVSVCDRAEPDVGRDERRVARAADDDDQGASRIRSIGRPPGIGAVCGPVWARLPGRAARARLPNEHLPPGRRQDPVAHRQRGHGRSLAVR